MSDEFSAVPLFTFKTLKNTELGAESIEREEDVSIVGDGTVTVIDFAASWCRPCWEVLPRLQKLADRHPELRIVVVSVDTEKGGRDELVRHLGLSIPVVWDEHHRLAEFYRPEGMPATVILDPSGDIVYRHVGSGLREWRALLEFLGDPEERRHR